MILKTVQYLYELGSGLKNKLYDRDVFYKVKLTVPVVSVGNLSVGGTGKTPCVQMLVTELSQLNRFKKIAIISLSYKARSKVPTRVNLDRIDAVQFFGDEPCLLQTVLPNHAVWSGPNKSETARAAVKAEKPDLIIVDDGFSHRRLDRDFDLVLIDATAPLKQFQTLPVGRLREPVSQLRRAQAILITRTNLVEATKVDQIKELILKEVPSLQQSIFQAHSLTVLDEVPPKSALFAFCGLGNPQSFKSSLEKMGHDVSVFKQFPDHYQYTNNDLDAILTEFESRANLYLVTTEKDLIKIKNHAILNKINIAKNKIEIAEGKTGDLIEKISQSF